MRGSVLLLGVVGIVALVGCREPTQIRVEISKAFECPNQDGEQTIFETGVTVGELDTYQDNPLATESEYCDDSEGLPSEIGNVVITPTQSKHGRVAFEVIAGYRVSVEECVGKDNKERWSNVPPGDERGCIWSSRVVSFSRHDTVRIPVMMRFACLNVKCDGNNQVCIQGNCVDNECPTGETYCDLDPPDGAGGTGGSSTGGAPGGGSGTAGVAQGGVNTGGSGLNETGGAGAGDTGGSATAGGASGATHAGATAGVPGTGGSGGTIGAGGIVGGAGGIASGAGGTTGGTGGITGGTGGIAGSAGSSGGATGGVSGATGGTLTAGGEGGVGGRGGFGGELTNFPSCTQNPYDTICNGESCCIAPWVDTSTTLAMGTGTEDAYQPSGLDEAPEHDARLSSFYLDRYEVTVSRFRPFVADVRGGWEPDPGQGAHPHADAGSDTGWQSGWSVDLTTLTGCLTSPMVWTESPDQYEDWPINCVNWMTAFAFCIWDGGRLPTEAEWEYVAAGGGLNRIFPFLSGAIPPIANSQAVYGTSQPASVGSGGMGWSHFDLSGNIEEWVLDFYDSAQYGRVGDPCMDFECVNMTQSASRVVRGGSYRSDAYQVRAAARSYSSPTMPNAWNGVRCARDQ